MERMETLHYNTSEYSEQYYTSVSLKAPSLLGRCGESKTEKPMTEEIMCNLGMHLSTLVNYLLTFNLQEKPT